MPRKIATGNKVQTLYSSIRQIIDDARSKVYRTANFTMVQAYWQIGKLIVEEEQKGKGRAEYGQELIEKLSIRLSLDYGKGFNSTNLWYMRQFYTKFEILHALRGELSWTHYRLLLKVEREDAKDFYLQESIDGNWSTRTLERQINSLYFERMMLTPFKKRGLIKKEAEGKKEKAQASDIIKDPYVLEFLNLKSKAGFYEHDLEQAIIDKLQDFLLELGKGFCFVARQYRLTVDARKHFYADLVFYNYILKCFVVIDLKVGELTHQDIGQMDMYVRYFEGQVKQKGDNPTIGLILCSEKNKTIVKYSLLNDSKQIFASKYKTYLPTEKQLVQEIKRERELVETEQRLKK
ncbi:MAG: YhcG family protein [Cyclobacteriaceae bacterium]|jgi:predicted nuclease of restriction endonuclease-like (RecB) superfamily|nr:PDDEXK nuclease domain-containing protein [Flammeovirgaceae bacterium]